MPTQFANTLNNHPIYADRAEKDAAGNTIATTYQEKLTAGTGITIDSSNVISATGGGGGSTYTAGNGIDITSDVISVQVTSPNAGDIVTLDGNGHLVDSGVAPSDLQPKLTAGANITIDANNVISASGGGGGTSYTAGDGISISGTTISAKIDNSTITTNASGQLVANGGGGTSYTAGTGIDISAQDAISVKIDGSTITTNASGQLVANGGGGGGSGITFGTASIDANILQDQHLFTIDGISFDYKYDTTSGTTATYITVSSSTVSTAIIDKSWLKYSGGWVYKGEMPVDSTNPEYYGVSLGSPVMVIRLNTGGEDDISSPEFNPLFYPPASFDFRFYYDVGNTHKVIYLNVIMWQTVHPTLGVTTGWAIRYSYTIG